jgi:hypothetical protein
VFWMHAQAEATTKRAGAIPRLEFLLLLAGRAEPACELSLELGFPAKEIALMTRTASQAENNATKEGGSDCRWPAGGGGAWSAP